MRSLLLLLCLCTACYTYAQDKLPAFGKIEKPDLQMTDCSFDPGAEALWLIDIGEVQYNFSPDGSVFIQTNHRCRIKILNEKGISNADVKISYYSKDKFEDITNVDGYVYNMDDAGNMMTTKLESKQVYNKKVSEDYSQVSFAMPNVKTGSVIEYRYRSYKRSIGGIDDWYFQKEVPVRYSAYNLMIPDYFDFSYKVTRRQDMEANVDKVEKGTWFIMRNIPSLKEEPYTAGINDYVQRVDFQLSAIHPPGGETISYRNTWEKLNEELLEKESFGVQLRKNLPGMEGLKLLVKKATDVNEKIRLIYNYVQQNMEWNGQHTFYSSDGIKLAWDKKSGTSGDINLLLVNLLKDAELSAYPMLTSTKDNGKVNQLYPFLYQFNQVLACAESKDGNLFIMDATDKYNPYTLVPYDVQSTEGLLIDKKKMGFLPLLTNTQFRHSIAVQLRLDNDGKLSGEAVVNSYDYGKNVQLHKYKKGTLKESFKASDDITLITDSLLVKHADNDSLPLEQHLWLSGNVQPSGDYAFIPYHLFTGLGKNPFTADKRQTDIDFNYPKQYTINGSIIIPENYSFDDLPKNMRMIMADTSIALTRILQKDQNILTYRVIIDFKRPVYTVEEYLDVKEFFKKLYEALEEKIVLKKKS